MWTCKWLKHFAVFDILTSDPCHCCMCDFTTQHLLKLSNSKWKSDLIVTWSKINTGSGLVVSEKKKKKRAKILDFGPKILLENTTVRQILLEAVQVFSETFWHLTSNICFGWKIILLCIYIEYDFHWPTQHVWNDRNAKKKKKEGKNVDDLFLKNRDESEEEMKDKETISQWKRLPTTASRTVIFPPLHFCLLQVIPSNLYFSSNLTFLQSPSTMFGIYLIILSNSILHFLFCSFLWLESILFCVSTYLSKTDGIFEWESRGVLNLLSGFHTHICAHLCVLPITSLSFISSVQ